MIYLRRPLAVLCLIFLSVVGVVLWIRPPEYQDFSSLEGMKCEVLGRVDKIEYKNSFRKEQSFIYLKQISYFHVIQEKQNQNNSFQKEINQKNHNEDSQGNMPEGLACYIGKEEADALRIGSLVLVTGEFKAYSEATNPGEFNAGLYYRILGLSGQVKDAVVEKNGETYDKLADLQFRIRRYMEQKLKKCYPEKEAGILMTMILGNKAELDQEVKELYQDAGILHILSVSGLHVSILGYGFYRVLCRLGLPIRFSALVAVAWMWFYGGMIGMGVSAVRAVVMFSLRMLAKWWGRTYDLLTALAVAAVLLIGSEPLYFYHSGFWLSFICVLAISLLYPQLKLKEKEGGNLRIRLVNAWLVSVSVTIATLPVFLWFYYEVSVWGMLWNLVVVPLMNVVMGGGIVNLCLPAWAESLSILVARGNCVVLRFFEDLCRITEWTGWGNLILGKPAMWQIFLFAGGMVILFAFAGKWKYYQKYLLMAVLIGIVVFRAPTDFKITFLDVGQGDGICVQNDNGNVYLVDGGSSSKSSVGTYQILPFLKHEGIRSIDAVFLSHADEDHISGIKELLEMQKGGVRIEKVILPDLEETLLRQEFKEIISLCRENCTEIYTMKKGEKIIDDKLMLTSMHPPENYVGESNASSQVLFVTYDKFTALLTGDVEDGGETLLQQALKAQGIYNITLLKVAHHGSRYSTDTQFVVQTSPQVAVISCGEDNSYGHPHEETLKRLEGAGCMILTTPECGAVTIEVDKEIKIYRFKK